MSTESYVPDEAELIGCYAGAMEEHAGEDYATAKADAERGIAKIKADALRVAAIGVTTQVNNAEAAEADKARDPGPYYHGARYGMRKTAQWLHRRADLIEGAIK